MSGYERSARVCTTCRHCGIVVDIDLTTMWAHVEHDTGATEESPVGDEGEFIAWECPSCRYGDSLDPKND